MYTNSYDIGEEAWIMERPSVAEMKRQYEEMVVRLTSGDNVLPTRSTNREKILYLRRKKLQDQVPSQDKRPKVFNRFSLSVPLTLSLIDVHEEEEKEDAIDKATNTKKIESVEEWWSDFHCHNPSIKYHINIGSLSIGDVSIMELSSKLLPLVDKLSSPPVVSHLDISWNDIYEEGMVAFSSVLEHLCISEIRMDGNQMATAGLEAVLKSLSRPQPKTKGGSFNRALNGSGNITPVGSPSLLRRAGANIPPISLSLRETNIGDESTTCLASYLRPLSNNKILNLVQLDLTNTYIFDGLTGITLALQNNTTLTTLILNSNMIGDQGAFAVGELLLKNQTINRLEMRNCDIGPTGTSHLCEGLQNHKGLKDEDEGVKFYIDVGLNPWEFPGELLLLQTAISKPKMTINWREGDWEPADDEELPNLIRTFGETKVFERLMDGQGFIPLASVDQLLSSSLIASYAPVHIGTLVENLSTIRPNAEGAVALMGIVVKLLSEHGRGSFKSWMNVLPQILAHLSIWMDPNFVSSAKIRRQLEVQAIDLLSVLSHINQHIIEDIVVRSGIVSHCLDNFLAFPNHNVYHYRLTKLIEEICSNTICGTLRAHTISLITGEFFDQLLTVIKEQSAKSVRERNGSLSAAVMLGTVIEPHLETRIALPMKKLLKQLDDEQKGHLCEPPPARSASKLVLKKDADI